MPAVLPADVCAETSTDCPFSRQLTAARWKGSRTNLYSFAGVLAGGGALNVESDGGEKATRRKRRRRKERKRRNRRRRME